MLESDQKSYTWKLSKRQRELPTVKCCQESIQSELQMSKLSLELTLRETEKIIIYHLGQYFAERTLAVGAALDDAKHDERLQS